MGAGKKEGWRGERAALMCSCVDEMLLLLLLFTLPHAATKRETHLNGTQKKRSQRASARSDAVLSDYRLLMMSAIAWW